MSRTPAPTAISAAVGCAALAVYAALKAVWATGGLLGVRDRVQWRATLDSLSGASSFASLWGTVVLDVAGAVVLVALARLPAGAAGPLPVRALRLLAQVGGGVLLLVGLAGLVVTAASALGLRADTDPLAGWVFAVVYGSFAVAGVAFVLTSAVRAPRRRRGVHGRRRAA